MTSVEASALVLMLAAAVGGRRRSCIPLLVLAVVVAAVANTPWLSSFLPTLEGVHLRLLDRLNKPLVTIIGNGVAIVLFLWAMMRLFGASDPRRGMARKLERRGDRLGAAELYLQSGSPRRALALFRKARAWARAAQVARDLGLKPEAAALLRRAGGRQLVESSRIFRELGNEETAQRCEQDLAEWLMGEGHLLEGIEAWIRAGNPERAARAANLALTEGRLPPSHPAFGVAVRAAEEVRDHALLARLREAEGAWTDAARAWRAAGEHGKAAANFKRSSQLEEAARAEAAAGRPRESVQLRIQQLRRMEERLRICQAQGSAGQDEARRLGRLLKYEAQALIPQLSELGMESELITVLKSTGRTEEAVQRLVELGQAGAAVDLAVEAQRWEVAAPLLAELGRWGEASDVYEAAGDVESAARCAERAGEDQRALQLYRSLGKVGETAQCLARLGYLQDGLRELHGAGMLPEACQLLRNHPGPVPDIPDVILDMAEWCRSQASLKEAIACLQRAVLGVALRTERLDPAVGLARLLFEAGDGGAAQAQLERVLAFDYAHEPAHQLKNEISAARRIGSLSDTRPADERAAPAAGRVMPSESVEQRYEILSELGRGGMGVVFQAKDTRLERRVAIKVLRTTSDEEAERLKEEAKAAATLSHPGIVTVFDFEAGFGGHFIAMEYVPGTPLDELMRTQPQRVRAGLVAILTRVADAVAYAHEHRIIHRDLKPGNILVTPSGDVKILDFGIAARLDNQSAPASGICGTPYYMAPEQIRGEDPTPASDLYSFGATSFHLATGQPPFPRGNVIGAHLSLQPPDPLKLAPDLQPELARIILRCLEKDPSRRFQSAIELREALQAVPA